MSTNPADLIHNRNGHVHQRRGGSVRASTATVTLYGTDIDVEYSTFGSYEPATATDPAFYPACTVISMEVGGVDCTRLLEHLRDEVAERVEASWVQL